MSKFIALALAVCLVFGQVNAAVSPYITAYSDDTCETKLSGPYGLTNEDFTDLESGSVYIEQVDQGVLLGSFFLDADQKFPYGYVYTFDFVPCVEIMDGTGAASGIFVHVLADPDDATTTIIKFYSDATCLTATGDADLTGVEWTASDATAKCFDVTITDDDSIKSLSVAQDATDNTLFLVTTHSAVQSGSNACDGDAYEAASTTVSACQLIPDYDGDVYVYLGGTVNDKLSFQAFNDVICTNDYGAAVGADLTGATECQDLFDDGYGANIDASEAPSYIIYQFDNDDCSEYPSNLFFTNTCFSTTFTTPDADTPTSLQIYKNLNSGNWYSQAYTDSTTCADNDAAVADELFQIDVEDDTTCQQLATGIWATVVKESSQLRNLAATDRSSRVLISVPEQFTFTTFSDDTCETATDPTTVFVFAPFCQETDIIADITIYAQIVYGEYSEPANSSVLSVSLFALVAAVLALLF